MANSGPAAESYDESMPDHSDWSTRRALLAQLSAGAAALPTLLRGADAWSQVPVILARISAPKIPQRQFDLNAPRDGKADCTAAFQRAIAACSNAGGGRIVVPPGEYLTGPIHLKSNVDLHVSKEATIRFVQDPKRYLPVVPTRWEGVECMNYSPFLYADREQNIAITGEGVLDGQADCEHWWPWKGRTNCGWKKGEPEQSKARNRLFEMAESDVPVEQRVFGDASYLRPQFIQPHRCTNVLIEGVTIRNSPMWEIHPVLCRNVIVRNVKVHSFGPNNDGCDPECCTDVWIKDCEFNTGDDCIAIKSGRNRDGRRVAVPSRNIVIQDCVMKDGHGGVTIGSEISGDVRHVYAENCRMDSPNLERVLRLKTNSVRGGVIEHVYMRNVRAGQVSGPVLDIDFRYEEGNTGKFKPTVRDIEMRDVTCSKSRYGWTLVGYRDAPIQSVRLIHCAFDGVKDANVSEHVEGLELQKVSINGKTVS